MNQMQFRAHQEQLAAHAHAQAEAEQELIRRLSLMAGSSSFICRTGERVTSYATLIFERREIELGVVMTSEDGSRRPMDNRAAREWHNGLHSDEIADLDRENREEIARIEGVRRDWVSGVVVHQGVVVRRDGAGRRKDKVTVDVVEVDGEPVEVAPGGANEYLAKMARARFPNPKRREGPNFNSWWESANPRPIRYWDALWVESGTIRQLDLFIENWSTGAYPVSEAMQELEKAASRGWSLTHVSEDHGIFKGRHARDGASLECVRYLLSRH